MTELVDNLVGAAAPATPEPATPTQHAGDTAIGSEQPVRDPELIKAEAMAQRYRRQKEEAQAELGAIRERMANIEGRLESTPQADGRVPVPRSLSEFSDAQLSDAIQNAGAQGNAELGDILLEEKVRRTSRGEAEKIREETLRQVEHERYKAAVLGNLQQRFFPEGLNAESPVVRHAEQEYAGMVSQWGQDQVKAFPEFQELALRRADDVLTGQQTREALQQRDTEIRELKAQLARMEAGANAGVSRDQEAHEMLAKGDIKGGLRKVAGNLFGAPRQ